ncbi:MAG TPA: HAMP domain-containing sensor histidine kinase [Croceibacterium sp.]|nr:HAMP domain-containing sensor histidine kinase [Croceibacterium sp.]
MPRPALTGGKPVTAAQTHEFRFRSELKPGHGSWIAVLVTYALGAAILFALVQFLTGFERFTTAVEQAEARARDQAAVARLLHDLDGADSRASTGRALARFEASQAGKHAGAAELVARHGDGASHQAIVQRAERLAETVAAEGASARRDADRSSREVIGDVAMLAAVVILGVFGGGLLFLQRSRHLERLLSQRAAELDEVDSSRRLFFATASHELRTPVTAIRGEAEVALADAEDLESARQALRHISANAKFLNHRIEEMIGIARTSDGKLHLDEVRLDLRDIAATAVDEARSFARSVEVALDLTLPDSPVEVVGDATWLRRAMLAIIENALKFSPMEGRVGVTLAERDSVAEVTVTDQGPGVMPEELPLVFEAYYQTDAGKARGGSGLGLSMTRWVAEQHGGRAYARNIGGWRRPNGCAVTMAVKLERAA